MQYTYFEKKDYIIFNYIHDEAFTKFFSALS
jgi:hypothetical protein